MIGRVRWHFPEVNSTQDVAFRLAELGAAHGTVVRADYQLAGRGRQGKAWETEPGSALLLSVLLRPAGPLHELGTLSVLTADILADVFQEWIPATVQIKWPNDVLVDGNKVAGILMQSRSGTNQLAIIGIGINIDSPTAIPTQGMSFLNNHTTESVDRDALLGDLLDRLNTVMNEHSAELSEDQIDRLESRLWKNGEMVSIIDADRELTGRIMGLAKNGALRLAVEGSERVVVAGEIQRGPRPLKTPT